MKLSELLSELTILQKVHGDIEVCLQIDNAELGQIESTEGFFVLPEEYDDRWQVNLRTWPY